jgi:hypothetical protein
MARAAVAFARVQNPAGWYPDPERPATLRWWNGSGWSDQWAPMAQPYAGSGPTEGLAIASLVTALVGVPIVPIVFAVIARRHIRESGGFKSGDGLAIAGLVIGIAQLVILAIAIVVLIVVSAADTTTA